MSDSPELILFVTGRLAEPALRQVLGELQEQRRLDAEIAVLGINVAALMHVRWVQRKLEVPAGVTRVILPGWCQGDLLSLQEIYGVPFERGPKDLRDLPRFLDQREKTPPDLSAWDIEILAEINHAPLLTDTELLRQAERLRAAGADRIDYGGIAGEPSPATGRHVRLLVQEGFAVSIDSFQRDDVEAAIAAGASLILSANSSNIAWVKHLATEVVVVPDDFNDLSTMQPIIDQLQAENVPFRLDPILEPIGFGFFRSLQRYSATRQRWPDAPMMMGVGNLTELSEVDSAGINFLLVAICQELRIHSLLTTQVINWARTCVQELDIARRLIKFSLDRQQIPKHLDSRLVRLRDPYLLEQSEQELAELAAQIRDPNFRIFATGESLHLMNRDGHWRGSDPFEIARAAFQASPVDPAHAFYLGYELAQAETARQLGKQYVQDEPLRWGDLTAEKIPVVDRHLFRPASPPQKSDSSP